MTDTPPVAQTFRYVKPDDDRRKSIVMLSRTDIQYSAVQVIREGGENNLHSHEHLDGFWFVLSGRARFYTDDDVVVAEIGRYEGVVIPRGYRYWFKSVGDEDLELLDVHSFDKVMSSLDEINADRQDDPSQRAKDLGRRTQQASSLQNAG